MIRKTLTIFSLIGLSLGVMLWCLSFFNIGYKFPNYIDDVRLDSGCLTWAKYGTIEREYGQGFYWGGYLGFDILWMPPLVMSVMGDHYYAVPLWPLPLLSAIYPLYSLTPVHRRRKRKRLGLCLSCGYDLRASKERCPECNTPFESHDP